MHLSPRRTFLPVVVVGILAVAPPVSAQDDLSGSWRMGTDAGLPDEAEPCVYAGDCQMQQNGSDLTGTVDLALVSGPEDCPLEMTASLDGTVAGDDVSGTLSGAAGVASFAGSRTNSFAGTFSASSGPFAGGSGAWLAVRPSVLAIPTLTGTGLTLLVLALLAGGAWLLRSERRPA